MGQEGIDLHRECRHVIHHDLCWNPATIEQRTGRVDRIGSKVERERLGANGDSGLDVLINVEILTEGVDIPNVQTVFLTRPTHSEILLRQMIGRALRGPLVDGGTEIAYLVSFEDHWNEFTEWEHPFELVHDIAAFAPEEEEEPIVPAPKELVNALPLELVQEAVANYRKHMPKVSMEAFEAVPHGWYLLENEDSVHADRMIIPVYAHQKSCWNALVGYLWSGDTIGGVIQVDTTIGYSGSSEGLYDEYFGDCDDPRPSRHSIDQFYEHAMSGGADPEYTEFASRTSADPWEIAREILDEDLGRTAQAQLVEDSYKLPLAQAVFPTLKQFDLAVNAAIFDLEHPEMAERMRKSEVSFDPFPSDKLQPGPAHDLQALMGEVLPEDGKILDISALTFDGQLMWTDRVLRTNLGDAKWTHDDDFGQGRIKVNLVLDSPDVSADTIKFVLWHEYLHLHLQVGLPPRFRELERQWTGYEDAYADLHTLSERFAITWWW